MPPKRRPHNSSSASSSGSQASGSGLESPPSFQTLNSEIDRIYKEIQDERNKKPQDFGLIKEKSLELLHKLIEINGLYAHLWQYQLMRFKYDIYEGVVSGALMMSYDRVLGIYHNLCQDEYFAQRQANPQLWSYFKNIYQDFERYRANVKELIIARLKISALASLSPDESDPDLRRATQEISRKYFPNSQGTTQRLSYTASLEEAQAVKEEDAAMCLFLNTPIADRSKVILSHIQREDFTIASSVLIWNNQKNDPDQIVAACYDHGGIISFFEYACRVQKVAEASKEVGGEEGNLSFNDPECSSLVALVNQQKIEHSALSQFVALYPSVSAPLMVSFKEESKDRCVIRLAENLRIIAEQDVIHTHSLPRIPEGFNWVLTPAMLESLVSCQAQLEVEETAYCGKGVKTTRAIPKGSLVGVYTGSIKINDTILSPLNEEEEERKALAVSQDLFCIPGDQDLMGYVNYAPTEETAKQLFAFPSEAPISFANLDTVHLWLALPNGSYFPMIGLIARQNIPAKTSLGFDYYHRKPLLIEGVMTVSPTENSYTTHFPQGFYFFNAATGEPLPYEAATPSDRIEDPMITAYRRREPRAVSPLSVFAEAAEGSGGPVADTSTGPSA